MQNYRYHEKLEPNDVIVRVGSLVATDKRIEGLQAEIEKAGNRFGFISVPLHKLGERTHLVDHVIVVEDSGFNHELVERLSDHVATHGSSASIAFSYSSLDEMYQAEKLVAEWKQKIGDSMNFLRPDIQVESVQMVSKQKIVDNAVCDTVRIKYQPQRLGTQTVLNGNMKSYFLQCSKLYEKYELFHRTSFDGYFAARTHEGFLITATKTDKIDLDIRRVVTCHNYTKETNTITYSGAALPSSDVVEAAVIFENIPEVSYLFHSHASNIFTRNEKWQQQVVGPPKPYGEPSLGDQVAKALQQGSYGGFVIMEEHGEVFAGDKRDWRRFLADIEARCDESV